ncbi:hypothetical protein QYF61_017724 [Mycteria americana]|uniref:Uncharacterized protein n=1 Tax=Mycteria americana TaxID=33587 RepID=A0AAN7NV03_MYCAM|nr:hypothetical protein QYF61_017724 [Mycteria americana]
MILKVFSNLYDSVLRLQNDRVIQVGRNLGGLSLNVDQAAQDFTGSTEGGDALAFLHERLTMDTKQFGITLRKEDNDEGPLQVLEGCYKVSLEPSLLQAEQPQLSQPIFIGEVLQPSDHLCGLPLDSLQQVHVLFMLGAPELDAVLQVESHQSGAEGQNHLCRPAGHASFYAAQDTVGLLGCERTLSAHIELLINQQPQVLLLRAAFSPFFSQPVFVLGIALTHVQDLALGLVELHEGHMGPRLKPVKVPLDGIPALQRNLMYTLNKTGDSRDICITSHKMDNLTSGLWVVEQLAETNQYDLLVIKTRKPNKGRNNSKTDQLQKAEVPRHWIPMGSREKREAKGMSKAQYCDYKLKFHPKFHRITESYRLEKTFKIIESNRKPNTTKTTTIPCP